MTYKENITAILECYFTGFKKEIIDSACNRILEQEPCDDAVSREVYKQVIRERDIAIEQLNELGYEFGEKIEQEPKTGYWIEKEGWDGDVYYECSVCGEPFCLIEGTPTDNLYNYCPNCGAKMVEPQERSEE